MGQLLLIVVVAVTIAAVVFGVTVLVSGRDTGLQPAEPDGRAIPLPATRPLQESDLGDVRFDLASRGYRMAQVDQALRRAAYDIGYKDELIGVLEAEVTALREGRTLDADALRRAREAAQAPSAPTVEAARGEDRPAKPGWSEFTQPAESDAASTAPARDIEVVEVAAEAQALPTSATEPLAEPASAPVVEAEPTDQAEPTAQTQLTGLAETAAEAAAEARTAAQAEQVAQVESAAVESAAGAAAAVAKGVPAASVSPVLAAESQFGEEDAEVDAKAVADRAGEAEEPYPVTEPYGGPAADPASAEEPSAPVSEAAPKANPSSKAKKAKAATNVRSVGAGSTPAEDAGSARR